MITSELIYNVGKFLKTHALKGELNAILEIEPEYLDNKPLIINTDGILVPYYIESLRQKGTLSFLIKLEDVNSETEAKQFVNKEIFMLKDDITDWLEEQEDLIVEFIGFKIIDLKSGKSIGVINEIDNSTENTLFVVKKGENLIYIPAVEDFIEKIDDENQTLYMNFPEGLLDINN